MKKYFTSSAFTLFVAGMITLTGCKKNISTDAGTESLMSQAPERGSEPLASPVLTYSCSTTKGIKIMVMNEDGSNQVAIATATSTLGSPCWSPDGNSIVFAGAVNNVNGLWIVDVIIVNGKPQGTNLRQVLPENGFTANARWSSDGKIFFTMADQNIYSVNPDGSNFTNVYTSTPDLTPIQPDPDPQGLNLAFTERSSSPASNPYSQLVVLDLNTLVKTIVTTENGPGLIRFAAWARNGDRIAYSDFLGDESVWTVTPTANATPVRIVKGAIPTWSPNDSKIAMTDNFIYRYDFSSGIRTRLASGSHPNWKRNVTTLAN